MLRLGKTLTIFSQCGQILPGAEAALPGAGNEEGAHGGILFGVIEDSFQLVGGVGVDGVAPLLPVEGDDQHAVPQFSQNVLFDLHSGSPHI